MNIKVLCNLISEGEYLLSEVEVTNTYEREDESGLIWDEPTEYGLATPEDYDKYDLWIKKVIRYLSSHHKDDDLSTEFIQDSKKELWKPRFNNMINILKAYKDDEYDEEPIPKKSPESDFKGTKVFIVHGRNRSMRETVENFIRELALEPVVIFKQANKGKTIIEKIEEVAKDCCFAVVLLSPDDFGALKGDTDIKPRARQNVVLELGYMWGKLGREKVAMLCRDSVERPSDTDGIAYIEYGRNKDWRKGLEKELKDAHIL